MKWPNGFGLGQAEQLGEKLRGLPFVARGDNGVVETDGHSSSLPFNASVRVCTSTRRDSCQCAHPRDTLNIRAPLLRRRELQGDVVGVAELQDV